MVLRLCSAIVILALLIAAQAQQEGAIDYTARFGKSFTLDCEVQPGKTEGVKWVEYINNPTSEPVVIFDSKDNPARSISQDHPKKEKYEVDDTYRLTVRNADRRDYGLYLCFNQKPGQAKPTQKKWMVKLLGKMTCTLDSKELRENEEANMKCTAVYRGGLPDMKILAPDGTAMETEDKTDLGLLGRLSTFKGAASYDGGAFQCVIMEKSNILGSCKSPITVRYEVRNLTIVPAASSVYALNVVNCSAKGNPVPAVSWDVPPEVPVTRGPGWASFQVPLSWQGKEHTHRCSASNQLDASAKIAEITGEHVFHTIEPTTVRPASITSAGMNTTAIVIGVVVTIVLLVIIIVIVVVIRRRNKPKGAPPAPPKEKQELMNGDKSQASKDEQDLWIKREPNGHA